MLAGLLSLYFSYLPLSQGAVHKPIEYVMCRNDKIVRSIRVVRKENGSCETQYTKLGVDKVVGWGEKENSCKRILAKIRGNLEKADWKCRRLSKAKIIRPGHLTETESR